MVGLVSSGPEDRRKGRLDCLTDAGVQAGGVFAAVEHGFDLNAIATDTENNRIREPANKGAAGCVPDHREGIGVVKDAVDRLLDA